MASVTTSQKAAESSDNALSIGSIVLKAFIYLILGVWALIVVFPMLWALMTSFKTDQEIFFSPWSLPTTLVFDNFVRAWTTARLGEYFVNTLIIVIPSLFLTLLLSSMAAYVLARFEFRGRNLLTYLFLVGMIFPLFLALVPLYFVTQKLGLLDTYHGLILVYVSFSLSFTIFFLINFFRTLPKELGEAATIDGASQYDIFFRIYLPLAKPGLITMGIFNFLGQWNQYILPNMLMITNEDKNTHYVLSQGLYYLQAKQFYGSDWSGLFAAVVIVMIPTLVVYLIFNDQIEQGMTAGAVKG
ncbi:carbohydrate ABC transporter permease [Oscillochloris sp. ZM17-4]|uniref:carbohydrate ABC transporter permease n=1 Tax=Oscillochloris sp. ZM17-4 TaxID=2866714 RepID=UPI001C72E8F7|nr:carbohydrate ABC transporter permease [Oscillochloris sp. ZM17-4]MBX0328022.1 carbohydrate ABC transporter permease [Oscillochloris sp. ZM17-4]